MEDIDTLEKLNIIHYPNEVLTTPADIVDTIGSAEVRLIKNMIQAMKSNRGVGLAAPQVGVPLRIFVMDDRLIDGFLVEPLIFINPEVISTSKKAEAQPEGCLSIPGEEFTFYRPKNITLRFMYDLDGHWKTQAFTGWPARCVQHELDHLNGILINQKETINSPFGE